MICIIKTEKARGNAGNTSRFSTASLGAPNIAMRAEDKAVTTKLMGKGIGKFAGAYSLITDRVVMAQDTMMHAAGYSFDESMFVNHYWDFGKKTKK